MPAEVLVNNAVTSLTAAVSTVPTAGTVETWTVMSTAPPFPQVVSGVGQYRATLAPASGTDLAPEQVTVISVVDGTHVLVQRGAAGSPVKPHAVGDELSIYFPIAYLQPVASLDANGQLPGTTLGLGVFGVKSSLYAGGARGDGATDDTAACASAISAAASAGGGIVWFPAGGTYMVSADLVAQSNLIFWAYGATIRLLGGAGLHNVMTVGGGVNNVRFLGGIWDGNRRNNPNPGYQYASGYGILLRGCQNVWLTEVVTTACYAGGFSAQASVSGLPVYPASGIRYLRCVATDCMDAGFNNRPGHFDVSAVDCYCIGDIASGFNYIHGDFVSHSGGGSFGNGPDSATEGDGINFQGCRNSVIANMVSRANANTGCQITSTAEAVAGTTYRGNWASGTTYSVADVVNYGGNIFVLIVAPGVAGIPPQSQQPDPYWMQCGFDVPGTRNSSNIKLFAVKTPNNGGLPTLGLWSAAAVYDYNDSVLYTDGDVYGVNDASPAGSRRISGSGRSLTPGGVTDSTGVTVTNGSATVLDSHITAAELGAGVFGVTSGALAYVGSVVPNVSFTMVQPNGTPRTATTNASSVLISHWNKQTNSGVWGSQGIFINNTDNIELNGCEASGNPTYGIQIGVNVTGLVVVAPTAYNNGYCDFRADYTDSAGNPPFTITNPNFHSSPNGLQASQSLTVKGGKLSKTTSGSGAVVDTNGAAVAGTTWVFEEVEFADNANVGIDVYPQANAVNLIVTRCTVPNSAIQGYLVHETSGRAGSITTLIDDCLIGTQVHGTASFLTTNSKITRTRKYPGSTGVSADAASGIASVTASVAGTATTIAHGLYRAPTAGQVTLTPDGDPGSAVRWYISALDATNITVTAIGAVSTFNMAWTADLNR